MSRRSPAPSTRIAAEPPLRRPIPVRALSRRQPHAFDLSPEGDEARLVARFLGLEALPSLRFRGELAPAGAEGWRIEGQLSAEVVQSCVVTLEPVAQRIEETVARDYVPETEYRPPDGIDLDPDAEDDPDPFGAVIDPGLLALESLALALDPYPRAPGVRPAEYRAAPPGVAPIADGDLKPFAKLAVLKEKRGDETG
jgi:uncharacterized metal-binding protein YceD (DUF177 family)